MTSEYSISVDWREEYDRWKNHGRNVLFASCKHKDGVYQKGWCEKCNISEDSAEPMMNYAYPLYSEPSEEDILKVVRKTNLTVMEKDGEFFLALCGGGMDLSQDIGLAYIYCGERIPTALAHQISTQYGLNCSGSKYNLLMKNIKDIMKNEISNCEYKTKRINDEIKRVKEKKKRD